MNALQTLIRFRIYFGLCLAMLVLASCSSSENATGSSDIKGGSLIMPVRGIQPWDLEANFGTPRDGGERSHEGLDIMAPKGREVLACASGVIISKRWSDLGGNTIWLEAENGFSYYYAHLSAYRDKLREGDHVMAAEVIGFVGNTGDAQSASPHLHFEIHKKRGSTAMNPYAVLHHDGVLVMPLMEPPVHTEPAVAPPKKSHKK